MSSQDIINEFKTVQDNPFATEELGNRLEYQHNMEVGNEFGGQRQLVNPPIEVQMPPVMRSQDQVGNLLYQTAANQKTYATDATVNSYRKIDLVDPSKLFNRISTGFQEPAKEVLKDDNIIFKYVPLNSVKNAVSGYNDTTNTISRNDYYRLLLTSLVAFIVCYIDSSDCKPTERFMKSLVAGLLGVIYLLAYLIKYTFVKCT
jgi:hypothetical protein